MEWYQPEQSGCILQSLTTCRDTPPLRTITQDTCLHQILKNVPLSKCHTKLNSRKSTFIRQLTENIWITSSRKSLHCLKIPKIEYYSTSIQHTGTINQPIILPTVALVNVTPGYTIVCPGFALVGPPKKTENSSLIILYNGKLPSSNMPVLDIYKHLTENTTWFTKNWTEKSFDRFLNHINQSIAMSTNEKPKSTPIHRWVLMIVLMSLIIFMMLIIFKYYFIRHYHQSY